MPKTLCLVMIVKNESKVIRRCFDSVVDYLDYWVIHDTGSTDGTPEIIESYMKKHGVRGELHHTPWEDFGYNRTKAIQNGQDKADLLLLMDADFIFHLKDPKPQNKNFKQWLQDADGYLIRYEGPLDYRQTLLVNGHMTWKYVGVTHEYVHCPQAKKFINCDAFSFIHPGDGGCRSDKFERDIRLLEKGLKDEPNNCRYMFYLAQSYKDIKQFEKAIPWYEKRVEKGGWGEEVYYSLYQIGLSKMRRGDDFYTWMGDLLKAFFHRPIRLEALFHLVHWCRTNKKPLLGYQLGKMALNNPYPKDVLFVEKPIHDYLFLDELGMCAIMGGKYKKACQIMSRILSEKKYHPKDKDRLERNNKMYKEKYGEYLKVLQKNGGKKPESGWVMRNEASTSQSTAQPPQPQTPPQSQSQKSIQSQQPKPNGVVGPEASAESDANMDVMPAPEAGPAPPAEYATMLSQTQVRAQAQAQQQAQVQVADPNHCPPPPPTSLSDSANGKQMPKFLTQAMTDPTQGPNVTIMNNDPSALIENLKRSGQDLSKLTQAQVQALLRQQPQKKTVLSLAQLQDGADCQYIFERNQHKQDHPVPKQPKILVLGNFVSFLMNKGISNNRLKFFNYLLSQENNVQLHGLGLTYSQPMPIMELVEHIYGPNTEDHPEVIVYYLMGTTDYFMGSVVSELSKCPIKKMLWIEDVFFPKKFEAGIRRDGYDGILLSYLQSKFYQEYRELFPDLQIYRTEPYIDQDVFKNYHLYQDANHPQDTDKEYAAEKQYDFLLYGYHHPSYYKFRHRLFTLIAQNQEKYRVKYIKHPGYNNQKTLTPGENVVNEGLSRLINQSYLTICTSNDFNIFVKKYIEVGCSNSIICGAIPGDYHDLKKHTYLVELTEDMSDEEIMKVLDRELANKKLLSQKSAENEAYYHKRFSYAKGYQNMQKILKEFLETPAKPKSITKDKKVKTIEIPPSNTGKNKDDEATPTHGRKLAATSTSTSTTETESEHSDQSEKSEKNTEQADADAVQEDENELENQLPEPAVPKTATPIPDQPLQPVLLDETQKQTQTKCLLMEWYKSDNPERQTEYHQVLQKNLENTLIDKIYLFIEKKYSSLREELEEKYVANHQEKLQLVETEKRMTFKDCFTYVQTHLSESLIIMANADIYFDQSLEVLERLNWTEYPDLVLALLRHNVNKDGSVVLYNNNFQASLTNDSQDVWIFQAPPKQQLIDNTDFNFGVLRCDNRLAYEFSQAGYQVVNCPFDVKTYHVHQSRHITYPKNKVLPGPILVLNPCYLTDLNKYPINSYYRFFGLPASTKPVEKTEPVQQEQSTSQSSEILGPLGPEAIATATVTATATSDSIPDPIEELKNKISDPGYLDGLYMRDGLHQYRTNNITSDDVVLEWASKDNTDYWFTGQLSKEYHYVNHVELQCEKVTDSLGDKQHIHVYCRPPNQSSWAADGDGDSFRDYIGVVDELKKTKFTKIFVTGRARVDCVKKCVELGLITDQTQVIVETYCSRRERYGEIEQLLELASEDVTGVGRAIFRLKAEPLAPEAVKNTEVLTDTVTDTGDSSSSESNEPDPPIH